VNAQGATLAASNPNVIVADHTRFSRVLFQLRDYYLMKG
jgi:hypothetical protein